MVVARRGGSQWLIGVVIGVLLAGCTSGDPSASQSPESGKVDADAVSYGLFGGEVCEQVPWDALGVDFGLSVKASLSGTDAPSGIASPGDIPVTDRWFVECGIDSVYASEETPLTRLNGYVSAVRYAEPSIAHNTYTTMVEQQQRREDGRVVVPVEGWWDDGAYMEFQELAHLGAVQYLDLAYYLHHGDLLLRMEFGAAMPAGVKEEGVALVHEFALRVADEVQTLLPVKGVD